MTRAVATMPTLLHISVFLFFAGLIDFLFPIYATVAYATFGCIGVFALAYAILTVLPNVYLNCPYGTPLSGLTWRVFQFSAFGFLWTILTIEILFRKTVTRAWFSRLSTPKRSSVRSVRCEVQRAQSVRLERLARISWNYDATF
jgi:hypothetical protein